MVTDAKRALQALGIDPKLLRLPRPGICTGCRCFIGIGYDSYAVADDSGRVICAECKDALEEGEDG